MGFKINNPFIDDSIVKNADYCPCVDIEKPLLARLQNGHNAALIGRRRVGKSSTAHHIIDNLTSKHKIEADFYHITNETDLACSLVQACQKMLLGVKNAARVLEFIKAIQLQWDVNTNTISVGLQKKQTSMPQLSTALDALEQSVKKVNSQYVFRRTVFYQPIF